METKKFKIFGEPWTLQTEPCVKNPDNPEQWRFGETNSGSNTIRISTHQGTGEKINPRTIELTKMHELIHAILGEGMFFDANDNEPLVEWLAKCLVSLKEQKII